MRRRQVRARLMVLALAVCAAGAGAEEDSHGRRWLELLDALRERQASHQVPALVLAILDRGRPVLVTTNSLAGARALSADTPFRWGSISKSVTALVALEAAREARLDLEAPVAGLLERLPYRNPWAPQQPVRLVHLLELTAGLSDLSRAEFSDNTPLPLSEALYRRKRDLLWPPGLQHSYSNVPPGLTAAVVEHLTGESFEAAAARLVLEPLAMAGAAFQPVKGLPGGFRRDGRTPIPYWHMTFRAFGALNASAEAMARFLEALLNQGRLGGRQAVAAATVARMYRSESSLGARHGLAIGYGAGLYGWVRGGHQFHGHGGDADGYRSRFGLLPEAGRGYLLGINVDDPALLRNLQRRVELALTIDLIPPQPPAPRSVDATALTRYAGRYYPSASRFDIDGWRSGDAAHARIEVADGGLEFRRRKRTARLVPLGDGRFRRPRDPAASVVFGEHQGSLYLQGELGNYVRVAPASCAAAFLPLCRAAPQGAGPPPPDPP